MTRSAPLTARGAPAAMPDGASTNAPRSPLGDLRFVPCALPAMEPGDVDPATEVYGRQLAAPLLAWSPMAGAPSARSATLAEVAQELRIGLGVVHDGGQHAALAGNGLDLRRRAPDVLLVAALDAVALPVAGDRRTMPRLVEQLDADALILRLGEAAGPQRPARVHATALLAGIADLCRIVDIPVLVQGPAWGMDPGTARRLMEVGVEGFDVARPSAEEGRVAPPPPDGAGARLAATFRDWAVPLDQAIRDVRRVAGDRLVMASAGIRTGVDLAKVLALGADVGGTLEPFARARAGSETLAEVVRELIEGLRVIMFHVAARTLEGLRARTRLVRTGSADLLHTEQLTYATRPGDFVDITADVDAVVARSGVRHGQVLVHSHHTTCAVRLNENEPLLLEDFRRLLERLVPEGGYEHDDLSRRPGVGPDEPLNGHAHCRHLLLGSSEVVPVQGGHAALGRWQSLLLIELCSARRRTVTVQVTGT